MFRKITIIIVLNFCLYSVPGLASFDGIKSFISNIFGAQENSLELPEIPTVKKSASSCVNCNREEDKKEANIPEDKRKQLDFYFVDEVYTVTRNLEANKDEVSRWFNILAQGGTREGVYRALVLDNTYRGLENYDKPISDSVVKFTSYFFPRFLNKKIKEDKIKKFNFYTLKRITTERCLEVLDEYIDSDIDNFYKWYAIFSGDLASKYPSIWKNKLRKNSNVIDHKKWAEVAPNQHIKSEVIIKLHKVFNSFN